MLIRLSLGECSFMVTPSCVFLASIKELTKDDIDMCAYAARLKSKGQLIHFEGDHSAEHGSSVETAAAASWSLVAQVPLPVRVCICSCMPETDGTDRFVKQRIGFHGETTISHLALHVIDELLDEHWDQYTQEVVWSGPYGKWWWSLEEVINNLRT